MPRHASIETYTITMTGNKAYPNTCKTRIAFRAYQQVARGMNMYVKLTMLNYTSIHSSMTVIADGAR